MNEAANRKLKGKDEAERLSKDELFEQGKGEKMIRESIGNSNKHTHISQDLRSHKRPVLL